MRADANVVRVYIFIASRKYIGEILTILKVEFVFEDCKVRSDEMIVTRNSLFIIDN